MLYNTQRNYKFKILIISILISIILFRSLIGTARAEWANHLVISAVQITEGEGKTDHDFIEIYNPTNQDINLRGYRLVKRTKIGTSDTSIKSWTDEVLIKAHSWRLWASSDDESYSIGIGADDATKQTVAPDNGIAIRLGASDTGQIIDSVAWGEAENIFKEGMIAPPPGISQSLLRKPGAVDGGNGDDTNNNTEDFVIVTNYIPHNIQSAAKPVMENLPTPSSLPMPTLLPSPTSGISFVQKNIPIAEAGQDDEAVVGENIDFDGSDSYDSQGKALVLTWDFGDKTSAKGVNVSHVYSATGDYIVILKADNGENVSEDMLKVKINAPEFSDKIILNEILPNPIGADKDGEWIEFFNSGDTKVNLRGWILESNAKTGGKRYVFSGNSFIDAKSYLVVKRNESDLALTNESGNVKLFWSADKIMSEVSYGAAKEGKSYSFINNIWQWTDTPTPGKENLDKESAVSFKEKSNIKLSSGNLNSKSSERVSSVEDGSIGNIVGKSGIVKKVIPEAVNSETVEEYLNKLITEKVDSAFIKAKAGETQSQEKILAIAGEVESVGSLIANNEFDCKEYCLVNDNEASDKRKDVRNNPWFYGDIFLSVLSLFLVWRYQEVRKKVKN